MKKRTGGFTLVELIVVFALIALFAACTTVVIASYSKVHTGMRDLAQMEVLANTLLDDIQDELSPCLYDRERGDIITVGDAGASLVFTNKNGYTLLIKINPGQTEGYEKNQVEGKVILYRYDVKNEATTTADQYRYWAYPDKTYMSNEVEKLTFKHEPATNGKSNIYSVELTLKNQRSGKTYTDKRYIECYNMDDEIPGSGPSPAPGPGGDDGDESNPGGSTGGDEGGTGDSIEVTVDGAPQEIHMTGDWASIAKKVEEQHQNNPYTNEFWINFQPGDVFVVDGVAYVCHWTTNLGVKPGETLKQFLERQKSKFIAITSGTKVYTNADIVNNGNENIFPEIPRLGELFWDGTNFYVAMNNLWASATDVSNINNWKKLTQ